MISPENSHPVEDKMSSASIGATPRELVRRQVEDQDYHITEEDMENMDISDELSREEKEEARREADEIDKDKAGTSYDILD